MGSSNIVTSQSSRLKLVEDKSFPAFLFEKFDNFGNKRAIVRMNSNQLIILFNVKKCGLEC